MPTAHRVAWDLLVTWLRVLGLGPAPEPPPYRYRCVDRSLLVKPFRDHWVPLFAGWLPRRVPANFVTLGASACMWAAACVVAGAGALPSVVVGLSLALLVHAYLVFDHADGVQAKRTGTSSALGEYLDHYLDAYHGPIIVLGFFALVGFQNTLLVLFMVWCLQFAFAATMVEEKQSGVLHLGRIGSLEGTLFFSAFFASCALPPVRTWWSAPLLYGIPPFGAVILASGITLVGTGTGCVRRLGRLPWRLLLFGVGSLTVAVAAALGPWPLWLAVGCVILYTADQIGRIIGSSLLGRREPWPDPVAPLAALLSWGFASWSAALGALLLGYLVVRMALGTVAVLLPLRSQWRWVNPAVAAGSSVR